MGMLACSQLPSTPCCGQVLTWKDVEQFCCPVRSWCAMDEMEGKMKENNNLESKIGESQWIQQTQRKACVE